MVLKAKSAAAKAVRPHLKMLGASPRASRKEMKLLYRNLAMQYHPDKNNGDDSMMKELNKSYTAAVAYADERDASGTAPAAEASPDAPQSTEVKLVDRIAKWMRSDSLDRRKDPSQSSAVEDHRAFVRQQREVEKEFDSVLGTAEEERVWAERFYATREARLEKKNHVKRETQRLKGYFNPFEKDSPAHVDYRLNNMTVASDPALYQKLPQEEPVAPPILASGRTNPHVARKKKAKIDYFLDTYAVREVNKERVAAMKRRREVFERRLRLISRGIAADEVASVKIVEQAIEVLGPAALQVHGLKRDAQSDVVNAAGYRLPKRVRAAGSHITIKTTDSQGKDSISAVSKKHFLGGTKH